MKKILFDLTATQPFGNNTRHGGGKYGEMVLLRMLQMKCNIVCYFDSKRWLNPKIKDDLLKNDVELFDINLCSIQDLVSRTKCDLVYSALPQRALFKLKNCNVYCTIHGLRRLELQTDPYFYSIRDKVGNLGLHILPNYYPRSFIEKLCVNIN